MKMSEVGQCMQHASTMDRPFGYLIHGDQAEPAPGPNALPTGTPLLEPDQIDQFFDLFNTNALDGTFEGLGPFGSLPAEANTQLHGVFSSLAQNNMGYIESPFSTLERFDTGHGNAPMRMEQQPHGLTTSSSNNLGTISVGRPSHLASRSNGFGYPGTSQLPTQGLLRSPNLWQTTSDCIPQTGLNPLGTQCANGHPVSSPNGQINPRGLSHVPGVYSSNDPPGRPILTFGSDAAFQAQYYAPPDNLDNIHTMEGRMMGVLAGLEAQPSANNTEPSSPLLSKTKRPRTEADDQDGPPEDEADVEHDGPSRSKRVRRMGSDSAVKQDSEPSAATPTPRSSRRDRSKTSLSSPQHRRRTSEGKAARQNLSEKQKQQNHIESEKRRRTHINSGIDDLMQLLPEGTVGSSKCVMLARTVEWLSGLKEGNKRLQAQLDSMEGGRA